jgi:hypothetical protein
MKRKNGSDLIKPDPFYSMAGGRGVEPRFAESESGVLPLNDPPIFVSVPARQSTCFRRNIPSIQAFWHAGVSVIRVCSGQNITTKKFIDQSHTIFDFRVSKRLLIGISSWDLLSIFLKTAFPRFNSSSPRMRTYRALSLSALRI